MMNQKFLVIRNYDGQSKKFVIGKPVWAVKSWLGPLMNLLYVLYDRYVLSQRCMPDRSQR